MLAIIMAIENEHDRSFVDTIYREHAKKMFKIANNILADPKDSEEVVHEVIDKIIGNIDKFKEALEGQYLEKIIIVYSRNTALQKYNQKARDNKHLYSTTLESDEGTQIIDIPDSDFSVENIIISDENCQYLHEVISKLDNKYRDVLYLKVMGMDNECISKIMNINEDLIRQRIRRARQKIMEIGGERLNGNSGK